MEYSFADLCVLQTMVRCGWFLSVEGWHGVLPVWVLVDAHTFVLNVIVAVVVCFLLVVGCVAGVGGCIVFLVLVWCGLFPF